MKKFVTSMISIMMVIALAVVFAACSSKVAGNTYKFDSVAVEFTGNVLDEVKDEMKVEDLEKEFKDLSVKFTEDKMIYIENGQEGPGIDYKQDGKELTIGKGKDASKATVKGKKIIIEEVEDLGDGAKVTIKITYKKA